MRIKATRGGVGGEVIKKGKRLKKGVDKRGAVWYNSKAHLRNGSAEAVQEWVMHLEN